MSKAYKCDNCHKLFENQMVMKATVNYITAVLSFQGARDICEDCQKEIAKKLYITRQYGSDED